MSDLDQRTRISCFLEFRVFACRCWWVGWPQTFEQGVCKKYANFTLLLRHSFLIYTFQLSFLGRRQPEVTSWPAGVPRVLRRAERRKRFGSAVVVARQPAPLDRVNIRTIQTNTRFSTDAQFYHTLEGVFSVVSKDFCE